MKMNRTVLFFVLVLSVLLVDQTSKFWVKTNMEYGDQFSVLGLDWAYIHFVENNGMAFGFSLGDGLGKLFLSIFRILAVGVLVYYIFKFIKEEAPRLLVASFSLILAGAVGNILDSAFYGLIFSETPYHGGIAEFLPQNGGYAPFLYGKVVDMLYFPLVEGNYPNWFPWVGGEHFAFFRPVFNVADAAISTGIGFILVFQRRFFK